MSNSFRNTLYASPGAGIADQGAGNNVIPFQTLPSHVYHPGSKKNVVLAIKLAVTGPVHFVLKRDAIDIPMPVLGGADVTAGLPVSGIAFPADLLQDDQITVALPNGGAVPYMSLGIAEVTG